MKILSQPTAVRGGEQRRYRALLLLGALVAGCGDGGTGAAGTPLEITVAGLRPLDPDAEGVYEAWLVGAGGEIVSVGRFPVTSDPSTWMLRSPIADPTDAMITVEPPGDEDGHPSLHRLLGGRFSDGVAVLSVTGYVTVAGVPLEANVGTHVLASFSETESAVPSEAGLWLFNLGGDTLDGSYYLDFSPLTEGWWYEGWIVRDFGAPDAVWLPYGKFRPDPLRQANTRDDTGLGPFSGRRDYEAALALQVRVPGDDWLANPLGFALPGGLALPLDLNGDAASGAASRWTHVITIEPWGPNRASEPFMASRPFFLAPYRNAIGEASAEEPRYIEFHPDALPMGTGVLLR